VISGRAAADCDEAAGAMRIKRLRDALGNQLVGELLIRTVPKRGYMLRVEPAALRVV
jgi:DNA-binding winged helix-turn-helix (wHTH) protein